MSKQLPRGIRNHNPGNIEWGEPWDGLDRSRPDPDPRFAQFISPEYGIRALARVLQTYQNKYGLNTIDGIISRWAPSIENNTGTYINEVAKRTGFAPNQKLDMGRYEHLRPVLEAIIRHENGEGSKNTLNSWYDEKTINKGLALAGVKSLQTVPEQTRDDGNLSVPAREYQQRAAPISLPLEKVPVPGVKPALQKASVVLSDTVSSASLMAAAFKKNPKQACEDYPEDERVCAASAVMDILNQRGGRSRTALISEMRQYLGNRIEHGKTIPTPQQAMKMVSNALGRGGVGV